MKSQTIAILGLGAMGSRVAQSLINAHASVVVYNRTPEKAEPLLQQGATFASTPREAAAHANVVMSFVTDCEASQQVWLDPDTGAVYGLSPGAIAIESSTLSLEWTQMLAQNIAKRGISFLDAPVLGSRPQADTGQLIYLIGGEEETLALVKDIFLSVGSAVHHVGSVGQGMAMKLAANALFSLQVAGLAEQLALLTRSGLTPEMALRCLIELPITSPAMRGVGSLIVRQAHQPLFPIQLVQKDLRYVTTAGADTPISSSVLALYEQAIARGYGNSNITGIAQLF